VQYRVDDTRQINASYSRRIQRPTAQDLNPYRIYQDPYNYRQGDPRLKPQVTDSFEVAYQLRKGYNYYLGHALLPRGPRRRHRRVRDIGDGVLLTTKANLAKSRSGGLELVANARLTPKISYTISGNAAWNHGHRAAPGFVGSHLCDRLLEPGPRSAVRGQLLHRHPKRNIEHLLTIRASSCCATT
jgi:outer membrane receptor protein involved in Fe transport